MYTKLPTRQNLGQNQKKDIVTTIGVSLIWLGTDSFPCGADRKFRTELATLNLECNTL
jgi:hypothetical protein